MSNPPHYLVRRAPDGGIKFLLRGTTGEGADTKPYEAVLVQLGEAETVALARWLKAEALPNSECPCHRGFVYDTLKARWTHEEN